MLEFTNAQVAGTQNINNALFAKFNMSITVNSTSSVNFIIDVVGGVGRITEVGVVYGIGKGLTTESTLCNPYSSNFGTRVGTISYTNNEWATTINQNVLSTAMNTSQTSFYVAPYYVKLYAVKNGIKYYGPEIEFLPNWPTVTENGTSKSWCQANLGALSVATSATDAASFGFLYQWGRGTDGHQFRSSSTTTSLSSADQPGHGNFIKQSSTGNWRDPANNTLWAGVSGTNNPCPSGWRIPTKAEWYLFMRNNSGNNNLTLSESSAMSSVLKLPRSQARHRHTASVGTADTNHMYYMNSSTTGGAWSINFYSGGWGEGGGGAEGYGAAVRCIQN